MRSFQVNLASQGFLRLEISPKMNYSFLTGHLLFIKLTISLALDRNIVV